MPSTRVEIRSQSGAQDNNTAPPSTPIGRSHRRVPTYLIHSCLRLYDVLMSYGTFDGVYLPAVEILALMCLDSDKTDAAACFRPLTGTDRSIQRHSESRPSARNACPRWTPESEPRICDFSVISGFGDDDGWKYPELHLCQEGKQAAPALRELWLSAFLRRRAETIDLLNRRMLKKVSSTPENLEASGNTHGDPTGMSSYLGKFSLRWHNGIHQIS